MAGKGSVRRPSAVPRRQVDANWARCFPLTYGQRREVERLTAAALRNNPLRSVSNNDYAFRGT